MILYDILEPACDDNEPSRPLPQWQTAVFIDRLAALLDDGRAAPAHTNFRDIADLSNEAHDAINRLHHQGVVNGTSKTSFNPFKRVTRGQIAAFINRLDGKREIPDGDPVDFFTDDGKLHEADINAVVAKGIMQGGGDGRFRPNAAITPGAMAAVLSRYVQLRAQ